jgi:hypothetical protein
MSSATAVVMAGSGAQAHVRGNTGASFIRERVGCGSKPLPGSQREEEGDPDATRCAGELTGGRRGRSTAVARGRATRGATGFPMRAVRA